MSRLFLVFILVLWSTKTFGLIIGYEYWFDHDYSNAQFVFVNQGSNVSINSTIDATSLSFGVHILNIRVKDSFGKWGVVRSSLFYMKKYQLNNNIVAYRYWVDNSFSTAIVDSIVIPPTKKFILIPQLNLGVLNSGKHFLQLQFKDRFNNWSPVLIDSLYVGPFPIANFSSSNTDVCLNSLAGFTNQSQYSDEFFWSFGDGNTSSLENPMHSYSNYGSYSVSLIARNSNFPGFNDTLEIENYINVDYCNFDIQGKVFIEGSYIGNGMMRASIDANNNPTLCDTITLKLADPNSPFDILYSTKSVLNTNGICQFLITGITPRSKYYIILVHRNSIEIWSKNPIQINTPLVNIDFTKH